jgi:two-component system sensor histidine kinase AlgZ
MGQLPETLRIPALTLQPLVENAIYHGIQPIAEGGVVEIKAAVEAGYCVIEVRNPVSQLVVSGGAGEQGNNRMAVNNIHDRLLAIYGPNASLELEEKAGHHLARVSWPVDRGLQC